MFVAAHALWMEILGLIEIVAFIARFGTGFEIVIAPNFLVDGDIVVGEHIVRRRENSCRCLALAR